MFLRDTGSLDTQLTYLLRVIPSPKNKTHPALPTERRCKHSLVSTGTAHRGVPSTLGSTGLTGWCGLGWVEVCVRVHQVDLWVSRADPFLPQLLVWLDSFASYTTYTGFSSVAQA